MVENPEIREKLKAEAWNQTQITEASHLVIFANLTKVTENYVNTYLNNIAATRDMSREDLKGMEDMIKNTTLQLPQEKQNLKLLVLYVSSLAGTAGIASGTRT